MVEIRRATERGRANFGWLDSRHTFSFGHYYDKNHMGHSALRVINDDRVAPGAGFDTHGHRDMEIISFVTSGEIAHKDSEGNVKTLPAGEFQLMSAGSGIYHSEYNASDEQELTFLQIWIEPNEKGGTPGYQQKDFGRNQGVTPIITPDGEMDTLTIRQNARLSQLILAAGTQASTALVAGNHGYVHLVSGSLKVNGETLAPGDGAKLSQLSEVHFENIGNEEVTALIFDLP